MDNKERIRLIRALEAASVAFLNTLRERGYSVDYGLADLCRVGSIRDLSKPSWERWPIGDLIIEWKIKG